MQQTLVILGGWLVLAALVLGACSQSKPPQPDRSKIGEPPGTFTIEGGATSVSIPFEFYGMNILVHARMNDVDIDMLIDNGVMWDELWFYTSSMADTLGIRLSDDSGTITGEGEGDGVDSHFADSVSISFGDVHFDNQPAIVSDASQGFDRMFPGIAGQACGAFFKHFIVEFNFDEMMMTLHDPATYVFKGDGISLPMTRDSIGSYSIPLTVELQQGEPTDMQVEIDLGGVYALSMKLHETLDIARPDVDPILLGYGASGPIHGYKTSLPAMYAGEYRMPDVLCVLADDPDAEDCDITVGLPFFMRYHVVFDYFSQTLHLTPNSQFDKPFADDKR